MYCNVAKRLSFSDGVAKFRERYARFKALESTPNKISFAEALTSEAPTRKPNVYRQPRSKDLNMLSTCVSETGEQITEELAHAQRIALASTAATQQRARQVNCAVPGYLEKDFLFQPSTPGAECDMCVLCNASVTGSWSNHCSLALHRLSAAVFTVLMLHHRERSAEDMFRRMLEAALLHPIGYTISRDLLGTSLGLNEIIKRFRSVLQFLKTEGVLSYSLNLRGAQAVFDQVERVGDLVLSPIIHDVLASIFDLDSAHNLNSILALTLAHSQTHYGSITDGFLSSNVHLEYAFDRLELEDFVDSEKEKLEGKAKADVVEAILGELQLFLWACEADPVVGDWSKREYVQPQYQALIVMAEHAKNLLTALVVLVFLKNCVEVVMPVVHKYEQKSIVDNAHTEPQEIILPLLLLVPHAHTTGKSSLRGMVPLKDEYGAYCLNSVQMKREHIKSTPYSHIKRLVDCLD